MSRHEGESEDASKVTNVAGVARRKGKRSRKRSSSNARPWNPSRGLYGDLKIPITEIKKKNY